MSVSSGIRSSVQRIRIVGTWRELSPFLPAGSRARIAWIGVTAFIGGLAESGVLILLTLTAESLVRGDGDSVSLNGIELSTGSTVALAVTLLLIRMALTWANSAMSARFAADVLTQARSGLLSSYLSADYSLRVQQAPGDLSVMAVNHGLQTAELAAYFTQVAASLCGLIAFGGASLFVNPIATVAITLIGVAILTVLRPLRQRNRDAAKASGDNSRELGQEIAEVEGLHREIEVFDTGAAMVERLDHNVDEGAEVYRRMRVLSTAIPQFFQSVLMGAALGGLLLMLNVGDDTDIAALGAVVLLLIRSLSSAQQLVAANQRVQERDNFARGVNAMTQQYRRHRTVWGSARPDSLTPLSCRDVHFSYDGEHDALSGVSVELRRGELIGIVGPSGAGKSTLVELLLRLRRPTSGHVVAGDTPVEDVDPSEWAARVAFVPQSPVLLSGTVAENVAFFRDIPADRITEAIKRAHLDDEIAAMPEGERTLIGAADRSLSGGQRQRLAIARALAGAPEILVLDEPTSALDAVSESAIRGALEDMRGETLAIVVAHRFSTLRSCDRILVIRDGGLEDDATVAEVAERSDYFKLMLGHED